jgi:hypothetical protein
MRMLPLTLTLRSLPDAGDGDALHLHTPAAPAAAMQGELTQAILGRALLSVRDLPAGWTLDVTPPGTPLMAGSEFDPLFIARLHARFRLVATGQIIEQEVGVLPQWALRHLPDDDAPALSEDGALRAAPAGDAAFTKMIIERYAAAVNVNAMVMRRHGLVTAIASWQFGYKRKDALHSRDLVAPADRRWAHVADAMFRG